MESCGLSLSFHEKNVRVFFVTKCVFTLGAMVALCLTRSLHFLQILVCRMFLEKCLAKDQQQKKVGLVDILAIRYNVFVVHYICLVKAIIFSCFLLVRVKVFYDGIFSWNLFDLCASFRIKPHYLLVCFVV